MLTSEPQLGTSRALCRDPPRTRGGTRHLPRTRTGAAQGGRAARRCGSQTCRGARTVTSEKPPPLRPPTTLNRVTRLTGVSSWRRQGSHSWGSQDTAASKQGWSPGPGTHPSHAFWKSPRVSVFLQTTPRPSLSVSDIGTPRDTEEQPHCPAARSPAVPQRWTPE